MHSARSWFGHRWVTLIQSGIALPVLHQQCSKCGARRTYDIWSRTSTREAFVAEEECDRAGWRSDSD